MATKFDGYVDAIVAEFEKLDSSVTFERGQLKRGQHAKQKRVVFVRDGGETVPPKHTSSPSGTQIVAREENIAAFIYAPNDSDAEGILDNLIRVYDRCLGNAWVERASEYVWATQTEEKARFNAQGTLIRLVARWRLAVFEVDVPVIVPINTTEHIGTLGLGEFNGDFNHDFRRSGSTEAGC